MVAGAARGLRAGRPERLQWETGAAGTARDRGRITHRMMYWKSLSSPLAPTTHMSLTCTGSVNEQCMKVRCCITFTICWFLQFLESWGGRLRRGAPAAVANTPTARGGAQADGTKGRRPAFTPQCTVHRLACTHSQAVSRACCAHCQLVPKRLPRRRRNTIEQAGQLQQRGQARLQPTPAPPAAGRLAPTLHRRSNDL